MEQNTEHIDELFNDVISHYTTIEPKLLTQIQKGIINKEAFFENVKKYLSTQRVNEDEWNILSNKLQTFLFGYYKLTPLLDDMSITDIRCHGADNIRVKKYGKRYGTDISFKNQQEYINFINTVATKNQRDLSMINAQTTFMDIDSHPNFRLRFDITTKLLNSSRIPTMHIRKIAKDKLTINDLTHCSPTPMMDDDVANFLKNQIHNNKSMIICGPNASGKTVLLNAAIEEYPHNKSALCSQENEELFSNTHPDIFFQHIVTPNGEGKIKYDLKDEIRYGLISDNDLFIIGEIKDKAALYAINAAYTGSACWLTVHSENSQEAVEKLADYAMEDAKYSIDKILKELSYMHMVINIRDFKIQEISMIKGFNKETKEIIYEKVFSLNEGIRDFKKYMLPEPDCESETLKFVS